jgi:replication factor A1
MDRTLSHLQCHDTAGLPVMKYNFVPLAGLLEVQKDSTCGKVVLCNLVFSLLTLVKMLSGS